MSYGYHPANLGLTEYPAWRVRLVAIFARLVGVQVKINGYSFGASKWVQGDKFRTVRAQAATVTGYEGQTSC